LICFIFYQRVSEEKKVIEKSLEEERKKKELEYQEILQQQELLLNEKEALLKKLERVQLKKLNLKSKLNKKESTLNTKEAKEKEQEHSSFNPFKSSTPKTQSPRSLSPVKEVNISKGFVDEQHEKDIRRIELIKQQMELINEQKHLKELLTKQEEMFSQKQVIHRLTILHKI